MGMSDKTMHFIAYMVLALLLWLGTSFEIKADWKRLRPWLLSAIVILYSAADEISQYFIHRSTDILDFASDALGAAAAMVTVSILSAYHIVMVIFTVCPLLVPGIVRSHLVEQGSILEYAVHITGFAIITTAWIKHLSSIFYLNPVRDKESEIPRRPSGNVSNGMNLRKIKYLPIFFAPPAGTVLIVKIYAQLTNKPFSATAILSAFASIILTLFIWRIISSKAAI